MQTTYVTDAQLAIVQNLQQTAKVLDTNFPYPSMLQAVRALAEWLTEVNDETTLSACKQVVERSILVYNRHKVGLIDRTLEEIRAQTRQAVVNDATDNGLRTAVAALEDALKLAHGIMTA